MSPFDALSTGQVKEVISGALQRLDGMQAGRKIQEPMFSHALHMANALVTMPDSQSCTTFEFFTDYKASHTTLIADGEGLVKCDIRTAKGITVNAISPGFILTPMAQRAIDGDLFPVPYEQIVATYPLPRVGQPNEAAAAIAFFCVRGSWIHHRPAARCKRWMLPLISQQAKIAPKIGYSGAGTLLLKAVVRSGEDHRRPFRQVGPA